MRHGVTGANYDELGKENGHKNYAYVFSFLSFGMLSGDVVVVVDDEQRKLYFGTWFCCWTVQNVSGICMASPSRNPLAFPFGNPKDNFPVVIFSVGGRGT